jgi:hypothetical protein
VSKRFQLSQPEHQQHQRSGPLSFPSIRPKAAIWTLKVIPHPSSLAQLYAILLLFFICIIKGSIQVVWLSTAYPL